MTPVTVPLQDGSSVSGLLIVPPRATACLVLAHGAGAGMAHPFMEGVATGLADRSVATLRYQFPFMEAGRKRPDSAGVATTTVRAAVALATHLAPGLPLVAGGKSFGGRMTSQAQAAEPLAGVRGLVFLGFPLHPPKKPSVARAAHLADIHVPMLFIQGSRDSLADLELLRPVMQDLGARATLDVMDGGDHGFHVPARSGRSDAAALACALDHLANWIATTTGDRDH